MIYYTDELRAAADLLNSRLKEEVEQDRTSIKLTQINFMSFYSLRMRSAVMPSIDFLPIGGESGSTIIPNDGVVNALVPKQEQQRFEQLINSPGGMSLEVAMSYGIKAVSVDAISWSVDEIRHTRAYQDLQQSGGRYVTADQVRNILQEVVTRANQSAFLDPNMSVRITRAAHSIFVERLLPSIREERVDSIDAAKAIDAKIINGTGWRAENVKPVQIMWEVCQQLADVADYQAANKRIRDYREKNKSEISASTGAGYGPFSASVGYSQQRELRSHDYFANEDEFSSFKATYTQRRGQEAVFIPRGIKLLEKEQFEKDLHLAISSVQFVPRSGATVALIDSSIALKDANGVKTAAEEVQAKLAAVGERIEQRVPVGTVFPYAGVTPHQKPLAGSYVMGEH